jgi:predicted CXXCH cytochrome family protein
MLRRLHSRLRLLVLLTAGALVLVLGASFWAWGQAGSAQAMPNEQGVPPNLDADYRGTRLCSTCHTQDDAWHTTWHARMVRPALADNIAGDLSAGVSPTIQWPDGSERPLTVEDITYVLGGRYIERYVSVLPREDGSDGFYVLPATWHVPQTEEQQGTWSLEEGDAWQSPEQDWRVACAGCHTTGLDGAQAAEQTRFAFAEEWQPGAVELNVGCESCHGPGGAHMGTAGTIYQGVDAAVCGQCHVQGTSPDGVHGYPVGYQPGLPLDESVFLLAGEDDTAVWWTTGHARVYNQYAEWLKSGHATSKGTLPGECARCHVTTSADGAIAVGGVTCVACHEPHGESQRPYQLVADEYELCVSCHNSSTPDGELMLVAGRLHYPAQEMYEGRQIVPIVNGIPSGHLTTEGGPYCETCHMPQTTSIGQFGRAGSHTMTTALCTEPTECFPDSCTDCHTDLSRDYLATFVEETQNGVADRLTQARQRLAERADAPDWVGTVLAFVTNDGSLGIHNYAYTDALLHAVEVELGLLRVITPLTAATVFQTMDPEQCASCHRDEYRRWQDSPHARASQTNAFLESYADQGRPTLCMSCHASGFDPTTGVYQYEGVVCSNCHTMPNDAQHPPAAVDIANEPTDCARCHSGAHAPTYDEWLVSSHRTWGIGCVDCHTPHENGLILGDVNTTCGACHQEALVDEIHMGNDMTCVDCHMQRKVTTNGDEIRVTGHTMAIDPGVCAECHGEIHLLSVLETGELSAEELSRIHELEAEVERLQSKADDKRTADLVGGALGALIVVFILFLLVRLKSLLR